MADNVVIVAGYRTPIGSLNGSLSTLKAHELTSGLINKTLDNLKIDPTDVSEVILGQALTAGQGQNPARQAALNAKIPYTVSACNINMLCGSGLKSVVLGCQGLKCLDRTIVICGGQESMSQAPHCVMMRTGLRLGNGSLVDTMIHDGLTDAFHNIHMGITAENIAKAYKITRQEQDEFAYNSQKKAEAAQKSGYFSKEIIPVEVPSRKGPTVISDDEYPKHDTTMEALGKLRPAFDKDGTITAGNASGINDGAAILVLMTQEEATKRKIQPLVTVVAYAEAGVDPVTMGLGPIPAIRKTLEKAKWNIEDVDLFELNEAFAAQSIAVVKELNIDPKKVNVCGGAIALGHPIGASGARVLVTLIHTMERLDKKKGVAALCIGGGMGIAIAVERQ